jgi:two-component system, chemotaxis family, sensor kinase CheA
MEINREMLLQSFHDETQELLAQMEQFLLSLENRPGDRELISSIFRVAHTLKGNASLLEFKAVTQALHSLEDLLDLARNGTVQITSELINLLLQSVDVARQIAKRLAGGDDSLSPEHQEFFARLAAIAKASSDPPPAIASDAATSSGSSATLAGAKGTSSLRVDVGRLDRMLNLTVEFAIEQGRMRRLLQEQDSIAGGTREALYTHANLETLFLELQELVMKIRMVPVGPTFHRFARSVRDMARKSGKIARMLVVGEDVEVDTTILEQIHDPLMHMIRNSIDHGLESPAIRRAAGKDPSGKIVLEAFHDSGNIVVRISDDGAGLDTAKIAQHAKNRGFVHDVSRLSESDIQSLIFQPGFSTADKVSELSGRGVGLDVVRRNVNALSGTLHIESVKDQGTTFTIRLPLTLAIIDGFAIKVDTETYVVPLAAVKECLELPSESHDCETGGVINLRGEALPFLRLRDLFGAGRSAPLRERILVVEHQGGRAGLAADELLGEQQAVIKPLGRLFHGTPGVSGSTILGDGRVALILDVPAICREAIQRGTQAVLQ